MAIANPALFDVVPEAERAAILDRYAGYLRERDGELDYRGRTLSRREEYLRHMRANPVRWEGRIDAEAFHRNHRARTPEAGLDELTLWLVATAKANRAERYGVDLGYKTGKAGRASEPCIAYIETEELYHSETLADVVRCFGLELEKLPPSTASRMAINSMVHLPKPMAMPVIFCSEVMGTIGFALLMKKGLELTASQPAVQQRVRELFAQILVDEIGHVAYCRAMIGAFGMGAARVMFDGICSAMLGDLPEFEMLFGRAALHEGMRRFDVSELQPLCPHAPFWPGMAGSAPVAATA